LSESDISPFATWEMELPKIIGDARYKGKERSSIKYCAFVWYERLIWFTLRSAIQSLSRKKALFDNFCRVLVQQKKSKQQVESKKVS